MIINLFYLLAGLILQLVVRILSIFNFIVPDFIQSTLTYFFSFFAYLGDLVPIQNWLMDLNYFVKFLIIWYSLKLVYWLIKHIPFMNQHSKINLSKE